ncbi:MAG TPA: hypothetical protein VKA34_11740 [Balneolales bacterium]|nr:hypothetical protein [Balneolales bacterium]
MIRILGLCVLVVILLESCGVGPGSGGETEYPPQTKILRIDLTPDTVATRDTVLIHCVIKDSLDKRFKYYWGMGPDTLAVYGTVTGPYLKYIAPAFNNRPNGSVVLVSGVITIDNGSSDSTSVSGEIDIPILIK